MSKNKKTFIGIIIGLIMIILFIGRILKYQEPVDKSVPCLAPGIPIIQHIHPYLTIIANGEKQIIPSDIGITSTCEKAIHTHDDPGVIHMEAQDNRQYTLGDFFDVWNKPFPEAARMTVDGKPNNEFGNLILRDEQEIVIEY